MARVTFCIRLFTLLSLLASSGFGAPKAPAPKPPAVGAAKQPEAPALSDNAIKHFNAGVAYADDPAGAKWEEAHREFLAAYADTPSWIMQNNIGLCALNLERDGEAIEAYRSYLAHGGEPGLSAKHRKQIETDIETLSASLVKVEIQAEPAQVTLIDERKNSKGITVSNDYPVTGGKAQIGIHPGRHKVTAEAPGYVSEAWDFEAAPASSHVHSFKLALVKKAASAEIAPKPIGAAATNEPPKPESPRTPTAVYVGAIATGVFAAAATVTGLVTLSKEKDYENAPTDAEAESIAKSGKTFRLLTDIEIGAAVLGAGVTAYFYLTAPKRTQLQTASKSGARVTPMASCSAAGISILGRF